MRFIKFDPKSQLKLTSNETTWIEKEHKKISSDDIKLQIPYGIAGCFGFLVAVGFIFFHIIENKKQFKMETKIEHVKVNLLEKPDENKTSLIKTINKIIFSTKFKSKKVFFIKIIQVILLTLLSLNLCAFISINSSYMVSYLTKGPAKLSLDTFFMIQMLFWVFYVIGRLLTTFIAYKMNNSLFFMFLLTINLILAILYAVPSFNSMQIFYWFIINLLATGTGPIIPGCFMIAKHTLLSINSVIVSIISIGMSIGFIVSQYLTGYLLDKLVLDQQWFGYKDVTSIFIIPYILLFFIVLSCPIYLIIFCIQYHFSKIYN
jgi:hypothetical protein